MELGHRHPYRPFSASEGPRAMELPRERAQPHAKLERIASSADSMLWKMRGSCAMNEEEEERAVGRFMHLLSQSAR